MDVKMLIKLEEALKSIQKAYFVLEQIRDAEEEMSEDLSDNMEFYTQREQAEQNAYDINSIILDLDGIICDLKDVVNNN